MLIRCAEFVGTIKAGKQDGFYDFVETTLTPLWTKFDGAVRVSACDFDVADADALKNRKLQSAAAG